MKPGFDYNGAIAVIAALRDGTPVERYSGGKKGWTELVGPNVLYFGQSEYRVKPNFVRKPWWVRMWRRIWL